MTNAKDTQIKVEDTIENLHYNMEKIYAETKKHEQCLLAVTTLINYQTDINGFEELLSMLNDQAENINSWCNFIETQYRRLHCNN